MKELFYERVKQFFGATVGLITLLFFACLPLYPYFKLPLHINLVLGGMLITLTLGIFSLILVLTLRKKLFPIYTKEETQWVQKAIRRYFWLYFLASLPFFFSFIVYIIFAPLSVLIFGYVLSIFGLILLKPRKEDLI
ncbi:hypothetical protein [Thermocrinis jamiesonii]|uniref:hypothetical protein n=1 Tax=Thermocrinis jamiesonii TaxID=1302351 RepID=UPI0004962F59|nr:hypothetical protein [Thermocrinis jamiesonii]